MKQEGKSARMMSVIPQQDLEELEQMARMAASRSYSPYSKFPVGAAVMTVQGEMFSGCNVENASYGLTMCAERVALFRAIAEGHQQIIAMVVYTPTRWATTPCGACRQVLAEFTSNALVVCRCDSDHRIETTLNALLPEAFGPHQLKSDDET